jgi:hypothetical protein
MMKAMALTQSAATAPEAERGAILARAGALRTRGARFGVIIMWLLITSAALMAVGRYL